MISVKEAAALLDLDERSIRERLINGNLRGEKRSHGQRDKWYVYAGAIETELKQKRQYQSMTEALTNISQETGSGNLNFLPEKTQPTTVPYKQSTQGFHHSIQSSIYTAPESRTSGGFSKEPPRGSDADLTEPINLTGGNTVPETPPKHSDLNSGDIVDVELSGNSKAWLESERDTLRALAEEMIKPLVETIQTQTSALDKKDRIIEEQKQKLQLLPDLEARKRELENKLEAERKAAQIIYEKSSDLERQLEEERRAQATELEKIKSGKEAETRAIQEQLTALTAKLEKLEQPWWKKLFDPQ